MHKKTDEILNDCFTQLSKVEGVCIHNYFVKEHKEYIQAWRLTTTISIRDAVAEDIIFILGFKNTFPYTLPDIYYCDKRYDYFPHIDYNNRKLCLYNENIVFNTSNPYQLIRAIIKRAKQIIQKGTSEHCDNFHDEIINYWDLIYGNEPPIEFGWIHTISSFDHSRLLKLYSSEYLEQYNCRACIVDSDNNIEYIKYFKAKFGSKFIEHNALFLANINIPATPPYSITTDIFSSWITSEEDSKKYHHYLRTEPGLLIILFRLGNTNLLGGFIYGNINTNRNGFRKGKLTRYDALRKELNNVGVTGMTVTQVMGCGVQKGAGEMYRGVEMDATLLPKVKLEIVVGKIPVDSVIEAAKESLYTGHIGDGKIFVYNVDKVVKIRTGEEDMAALQDVE